MSDKRTSALRVRVRGVGPAYTVENWVSSASPALFFLRRSPGTQDCPLLSSMQVHWHCCRCHQWVAVENVSKSV
jgi:hypothetical protein